VAAVGCQSNEALRSNYDNAVLPITCMERRGPDCVVTRAMYRVKTGTARGRVVQWKGLSSVQTSVLYDRCVRLVTSYSINVW